MLSTWIRGAGRSRAVGLTVCASAGAGGVDDGLGVVGVHGDLAAESLICDESAALHGSDDGFLDGDLGDGAGNAGAAACAEDAVDGGEHALCVLQAVELALPFPREVPADALALLANAP